MPDPFAGIKEKLKRSNEHIGNLNVEVSRFFQECQYPILPENDKQLLLDALHYHQDLVIPPRLSVLAGEIIHQLRSCLDHVVWIFSSDEYRERCPKKIEFPVFEEEPVDKNKIHSYQGAVKGITNSKVLNLIERLQPYNAPDPVESPILIVHNLDIVDKHREVLLVNSTGARDIPKDMHATFWAYKRQHPELSGLDLAIHFQGHGKLVPVVSFKNFGRRKIQPVMPALIELNNSITSIVSQFSDLFPR